MRFGAQSPGLVILLAGSGSILLMMYFFHQSSEYFKIQEIKSLAQHSVHQDEVLVPMEEIIKGRPILLRQDEPRLIHFIKSRGYLLPPSNLEYNLTEPNEDPSMGQSQVVRQILGNMTNGVFVECGALDGETRSNTLFFEKQLGWTGLIIEGDPKNFQKIIHKHRKAWAANACLAIKSIPHEVIFQQNFNTGKILKKKLKSEPNNIVPVQCFPFFSLVSAVNITKVDYFSLDVEGSELEVLKTIPFDSIFIKVLSVEFNHVKGGQSGLKQFFAQKGYKLVSVVTYTNHLANDLIFVHPNVTVNLPKNMKAFHNRKPKSRP